MEEAWTETRSEMFTSGLLLNSPAAGWRKFQIKYRPPKMFEPNESTAMLMLRKKSLSRLPTGGTLFWPRRR